MKRLNLSLIVSLAEIVSSLAIIISLFYLANEYKRTNTLTNRDVEAMLYENMQEMDRIIIENEKIPELLVKVKENNEKLNEVEKLKYLAFEHIFFDSWESAYFHYKEGTLTPESWGSWNAWFVAELQLKPDIAWEGNRKNYSGAFLTYIDNLRK